MSLQQVPAEIVALQVGRLDEIPVDHGQAADAGADHRLGQGGAQRPAADDEDP